MSNQKLPVKNKTLLQILSFLAAIVLWFVITYTEDPVITITLNNIPVTVSDENALHEKNLIFTNGHELPNISINVRGKRSDIRSILNSVTAKIDLNDITKPGEYTKKLNFDVPNTSVMITKSKIESVNVIVESEIEKEIPVFIMQTGTHENLVKCSSGTDKLTVSGSSYDVSRIKEALVTVDISNIKENSKESYPVVLADETHAPINTLHSTFTVISQIDVTSTIYIKKYADIELSQDEELDDYHVSVYGFSKDKLEIGVLPGAENKHDIIYVEFLNKNMYSMNNEYKMKPIIPSDVYCPTENDEIIMTAEIESMSETTLSLDITVENAPQGKTIYTNPESLSVNVTAPKSQTGEIKATVDLSGLPDGVHSLPVKFKSGDTEIKVKNTHNVTVTIQ